MTKKITIALAGNPNCGKSSIFNNLTGARQHVGNYPGVTVEKKEGRLKYKDYEIKVIDLPGTYSLSAYSEDEIIARNFIVQREADIIVNIIDSSNLERNLYLTTQLMELDAPLVLAMNMSDIVEKRGEHIDYSELSKLLGHPLIPTVGNKNKGTQKLLETIIGVYERKIEFEKVYVSYGADVRGEMDKIEKILIKDEALIKAYPLRWLIIKLIEDDRLVLDVLKKSAVAGEALERAEKSRRHLKAHFGDSTDVIVAERRYGFISGACTQSFKVSVEERHTISDKIDRIVLNRFAGVPIFAVVMYFIFKFTFVFSGPVVGWCEGFFDLLAGVVTTIMPEGLFQSLVVDGIIGGVGGVLGFFPLILFMFFAVAFFEDSGYMARAAFVMDKLMSKFGLHGKSFLPMMISTNGCAVPGIMATRTLENKRDRLITMMVTPFMICGAKLPIFALFIGAFFPAAYSANIMFLMYVLSIFVAFSCAKLLKVLVFKGESAHFVMELPPYRIPTFKGILLKMWERGWMYIKKAGTIIVLVSIIIWAGFTFPQNPVMEKGKNLTENEIAAVQMEKSYAGRVGHIIEPVIKPLGLDWRAGVALVAGFAAKEVVVSTYGTMYSLGEVDPEEADSLKETIQKDVFWNPLKAMSFLIFSLIYIPCVVVMAVFHREAGSSWKWTSFMVFWTTALAWTASFIVYQVGMLFGLG